MLIGITFAIMNSLKCKIVYPIMELI